MVQTETTTPQRHTRMVHAALLTSMLLTLPLWLPVAQATPTPTEVDGAIHNVCLASGAVASLAVDWRNGGRSKRQFLSEMHGALAELPFETNAQRADVLAYWTRIVEETYRQRRGSVLASDALTSTFTNCKASLAAQLAARGRR